MAAYILHGNISSAARAVGVSRFAVSDWRHNDPRFKEAFESATLISRNLAIKIRSQVKQIWSKLGMEQTAPSTHDCITPIAPKQAIGVAVGSGVS